MGASAIRLDAYAGQPLLILFRTDAPCEYGCHYTWFIDDVEINVYPPDGLPTPVPTAIPSNTPIPTPTQTPTATPHAGQFQDVPPPHPFYAYIECLGLYQIITGYPCGGPLEPCVPDPKPYFRPGNFVTRGQVAKMLSSIAGWARPHSLHPTNV